MRDSSVSRVRTSAITNRAEPVAMPVKDGTTDEVEPEVTPNPRSDTALELNPRGRHFNEEPDDDPHTPGVQSRVRDQINVSYSVGAVAKHLGVSPATLRTWDRRYGLGPSDHPSGSHRRYDATDIERLTIVRRLTAEGVSTAEAAQVALASDVQPASLVPTLPGPVVPNLVPETTTSELVKAAFALDVAGLGAMLASISTIDAWWAQVGPALTELWDQSTVTKPGEAPLEILRYSALAELARRRPSQPVERTQVLVISAHGYADDVAMHALGAALEGMGIGVSIVTGTMTTAELSHLIEREDPTVLAVVADSATDADLNFLTELPNPPLIFLTGASLALNTPIAVERVRTFSGAVHEISAAVAEAGSVD